MSGAVRAPVRALGLREVNRGVHQGGGPRDSARPAPARPPQPHSVLPPPTPGHSPSYQSRSPCWLPPAPTLSSPRSSLPPACRKFLPV